MRAVHFIALTLLSVSLLPAQRPPSPSVSDLVRQFDDAKVFTSQFEIAKKIVAANDVRVLPQLEHWLTNDDRSLRGNAAFIFGRLGDPRGFEIIVGILADRSPIRVVHQISSVGTPCTQCQIRQDRYYAAHLLGDLKDRRALPVLLPLLKDSDLNYIVPWALGQIGDPAAITPLMELLNDPDPGMRVLAIDALVDLRATEAIPRFRELLNDKTRPNFGKLESVAEAAQAAITRLQ